MLNLVVHIVTTGLQKLNAVNMRLNKYLNPQELNVMLYETLSPYRAINTLPFGYKNQSVNAV